MGCEKAILLAGSLWGHYKTICTEEQKQASINPENKSVYAGIFKDIQGCCVQFNNEMSAVKVYTCQRRQRRPGPKGREIQ